MDLQDLPVYTLHCAVWDTGGYARMRVCEGAKTVTGHSSTNRFSTSPYLSSALSSSIPLFLPLLEEMPFDYISITNILATCSLFVRKAGKTLTVHHQKTGEQIRWEKQSYGFAFVCAAVCVGGVVLCFRVTSVAQAACLLEQGLLDHQKVGASPLAMVIRSRHSDGQSGHYPVL